MALNFPSDTSVPYIDPNSGLKYIFNSSVGAWETAIQPPAIISDRTPSVSIPGFFWWDSDAGSLYIYYDDGSGRQWVEAVPSPDVPRPWIGDAPPLNPVDGDLWWDSNLGRLFIYYDDGSGLQWVDASPNLAGTNAGGGATRIDELLDVDTTTRFPLAGQVLSWDGLNWVPRNAGSSGSGTVEGQLPIQVTQNTAINRYTVGITQATENQQGSARYAQLWETRAATDNTIALTPGYLRVILQEQDNLYIPSATQAKKGLIELATYNETITGLDNQRAVTPRNLRDAVAAAGQANPTGTVITFAGQTAPDGYLVCDGSNVSRSTYLKLFDVIGTLYGIGDGSTTFTLPDLRGEFVRGWDRGKGTDPGRAMGSFQQHALESHNHSVNDTGHAHENVSTGSGTAASGIQVAAPGGGTNAPNTDTSTTGITINSAGTAAETRPRNVAMLMCIKT